MNPPGSPRVRRLRLPSMVVLVGLLVGLLPLAPAQAVSPVGNDAISFDGSNDRVRIAQTTATTTATNSGPSPQTFTIELWFNWTGGGTTASTGGTALPSVIPLVSKGRSENEGAALDVNYFLGINTATAGQPRLAADFEQEGTAGGGIQGENHPITGTTVITTNVWHHAAATYSSTAGWALYLDGVPNGTLASPGWLPNNDNTAPAALGTAYQSAGTEATALGFFAGSMDEVRIWNTVRTQAQVTSTMNRELPFATGLIRRFSMNEGSGTTAFDSAGGTDTTAGSNPPHGNLLNGPTWATGAPVLNPVAPSGAHGLSFDGNGDFVTFGRAASLGVAQFTLELWFNKTGAGSVLASTGADGLANVIPLLTKGRNESDLTPAGIDMNYFLGLDSTGRLVADFEDMAAGAGHPVVGTTVIANNAWHHAAVTYNSTGWNLYLDGNLEKSESESGAVPRSDSMQQASLGSALQTHGAPSGFFQGLIDEARIWNTVRTQAQIQASMNQELTSGSGLIGRWGLNEPSGFGAASSVSPPVLGALVGDTTQVAGAPAFDNAAPVVDSVAINETSPHTNDVLSVTVGSHDDDLDPLTFSYQWRKNNVDLAGQTGATLNLATANNGNKNDQISVRVTASDGTASSNTMTSSNVTILNTAPGVDSVAIDQSNPGPTDTLTATIASHDDDNPGETITYAYQWRKNGSNLGGQTNATLDLGAVGAANNDQFALRVIASDGTLTSPAVTSDPVIVVVGNAAPVVDSVDIDETAPNTNTILHTTVFAHDPDGGTPSLSYQWKKNGSDLVGETGDTLNLGDPGNGNKGDQITVVVIANDGSLDSAPLESDAVTILNSAPVVDSVSINQASPHTNDILTATINTHDIDGDTVTLSRQWRKGGSNIAGETGTTLDLGEPGNGDKGDVIRLRVTASDGTVSSGLLDSAPVTILNSAPSITSATISPGTPPDTDDILSVNIVSNDADGVGDTTTYTYQWLKNGSPISGATNATLNLGSAGNGDKGNQISVQVVGHDTSAATSPVVTSPAVTIQNKAPVINSVTINESSPNTGTVLTVSIDSFDLDGDGISYTYQWRKNGSDFAGQTASTLGLAGPGIGDKGDSFAVRVTAFDGTASSGSVTSAPPVTVVNTAPVVNSVTLNDHSPSSSETITANVSRSDADNDTVTLTYVWRVNGTTRQTITTTATADSFDLSLPNHGNNGDTVTVTVTPNDGSVNGTPVLDTASVGNAAPTINSVTIGPASPTTNQLLSITNIDEDDPDGDTLTHTYQWYKGASPIAGATNSTLDLSGSNGNKGDQISVRVIANDGAANSGQVASNTVTVANSAPTPPTASINETSPGSGSILSVTRNATDPDGDAVTYAYQWIKNGSNIVGETGATLNLGTNGNGDEGDQIAVRVTANDGSANSTPTVTTAVTIVNSAPTVSVPVLDDTTPDTNATINATVTRSDADPGDTVTLTYVWDVNGTVRRTTVTTALSDNFDLSLPSNGDPGQVVTVTVTPSDGTVAGTPRNASANVTGGGGNLAPVATNSSYGVTKAQARTITLRATDPEGAALTYTIVTPPNSGTIAAGTGPDRIYTPVNSFNGTVTFTFRANDGSLNSNIATVTLTIAPMKKVTINDASFNPLNVAPAMCAAVRFVNKGAATHSVSDTGGLLLYSSGTINPNAEFRYRYSAAGNYTFQVAGQGAVGRAKVPLIITPASGGTSTQFTVNWACEDPAPGYVFDIQIKRGTGAFVNWQNGVTTLSAIFTPDMGPRVYKFRARLRNTSSGAFSGWSAAKGITVS